VIAVLATAIMLTDAVLACQPRGPSQFKPRVEGGLLSGHANKLFGFGDGLPENIFSNDFYVSGNVKKVVLWRTPPRHRCGHGVIDDLLDARRNVHAKINPAFCLIECLKLTVHLKAETARALNVLRWRLTGVFDFAIDDRAPVGEKTNLGVETRQVTTHLSLTDALSLGDRRLSGLGPGLCVLGGISRVEGGSPGCDQSKCSDQTSDNSQPPSGIRGAAGCVGGIPLGAKVGTTALIALGAFGVMFAGFGRVLNGGRYAVKGFALIGAGIGLWVASAIPWWSGG
jgi:hypothetical protein